MTERSSEAHRLPWAAVPSLQDVGRWARRRAAVLPLALFLVVLSIQWLAGIPHVSGDTQKLVTGAQATIDCLAARELTDCEATPPPIYTTVGPFAVLQYVPAVAVLALGGTSTQALTTIWVLSALAFVGLVAVGWLVADRTGQRIWAPGLALVAVTGPLLFYSNSTFGEMLGAFLAVLLVATLTLRMSWAAVAGAAWLAGITKETAFPFLLALGLIALLVGRGRTAASPRSPLVGLALGLGLALATNALFNVFRYGTLSNQLYLDAPGFVQGLDSMPLGRRPDFFAALLVSPNGGLLFFWPAAALLLAATAAIGFVAALRRAPLRDWLPAAAITLVFVGLVGGLASFTYPFGWHTWGPRYTITWIPAFALVAVVAYGDRLARLVAPVLRSLPRLAAAGAALSLLALPHVGALLMPGAFARLFVPDERCPAIETLRGERYLDCLHELAWARRPMLLDGLEALPEQQPGSSWVVASLAVAVFGLLGAMRSRLPAVAERAAPPPARPASALGAPDTTV